MLVLLILLLQGLVLTGDQVAELHHLTFELCLLLHLFTQSFLNLSNKFPPCIPKVFFHLFHSLLWLLFHLHGQNILVLNDSLQFLNLPAKVTNFSLHFIFFCFHFCSNRVLELQSSFSFSFQFIFQNIDSLLVLMQKDRLGSVFLLGQSQLLLTFCVFDFEFLNLKIRNVIPFVFDFSVFPSKYVRFWEV